MNPTLATVARHFPSFNGQQWWRQDGQYGVEFDHNRNAVRLIDNEGIPAHNWLAAMHASYIVGIMIRDGESDWLSRWDSYATAIGGAR